MSTWECPRCEQDREGRYCPDDGHDSELPPASVVATIDPVYFDFVLASGGATGLTPPTFAPERRFLLTERRMLIGRRSVSRGVEPEIDLTGPPEDLAIGRSHALLVAGPDGSWSVVDLGSVNGTYLNHGADPVEPNIATPLFADDLIHLGAWTTLRVVLGGGGSSGHGTSGVHG